MRCPECGNEVSDGIKFCTNCGSSIQPSPASPEQEQLPVSPGGRKGGAKSTPWIIVSAVLGLVLIAGIGGGIVYWIVTGSNKPQAVVESVELKRSDGKTLDLKDVPLDVDLVAEVKYIAKFKEGGKGELKVTVTDSSGEDVMGDTYDVESSDGVQSEKHEFSVIWSEGETFNIEAKLEVSVQGEKLGDSETLEYYVAEGVGETAELEEAREKAKKKLDEAANAVAEIIGMGVEAEDLVLQLTDAENRVESVSTREEADELYGFGEAVITECNARKLAYEDEKRRQEEEARRQAREQEIAACRSVMYAYASEDPFPAESVELTNLQMNDECTYATATVVGRITAHTVPERAGEYIYGRIVAQKQGGHWVVTDWEYGIPNPG